MIYLDSDPKYIGERRTLVHTQIEVGNFFFFFQVIRSRHPDCSKAWIRTCFFDDCFCKVWFSGFLANVAAGSEAHHFPGQFRPPSCLSQASCWWLHVHCNMIQRMHWALFSGTHFTTSHPLSLNHSDPTGPDADIDFAKQILQAHEWDLQAWLLRLRLHIFDTKNFTFFFFFNLGQAALETVTGGVWILRNWATKKNRLLEENGIGESFLSESYQILPNLVSVGSSDRLSAMKPENSPFFVAQVVTSQGCSAISWGGRTFMIT